MKKSRYTEEQIIGFIKQAESGLPIKDLCRKGGFSDATFYKWRAKYGGMDVPDARRLRELEAEMSNEDDDRGIEPEWTRVEALRKSAAHRLGSTPFNSPTGKGADRIFCATICLTLVSRLSLLCRMSTYVAPSTERQHLVYVETTSAFLGHRRSFSR